MILPKVNAIESPLTLKSAVFFSIVSFAFNLKSLLILLAIAQANSSDVEGVGITEGAYNSCLLSS